MCKRLMQISLPTLLLVLAPQLQAAAYSASDANEIRRILQQADVDSIQQNLLIRRMEARKVPASLARDWAKKIAKVKERKLPVKTAVDRLQQGLIKNIKLGYLGRALDVLLNNLAWSNELIVNKAINDPQQANALDDDEQDLLSDATLNLEIASRQGYKRNEITVLMSRKGVDLEMAAELAKTLTVWTNYGVENRRILLSLKRISRLGLPADKVQDIRESVDSKIVADKLLKPADIAKAIWHEIRAEAEVMDAEHAYRTGMQHNPNSLKGTGNEHGSLDELNISDVEVIGDSVGGDTGGIDSGSIDSGTAGMDPGAGAMDPGSGGGMDGGSSGSESGSGDSSGGSDSGGMGGMGGMSDD